MSPVERELLVSQILAGQTLISVERAGRGPARFVVDDPKTAAARLAAAAVFERAYRRALADGLPTADGAVDLLRRTGQWDVAEDRALAAAEADVDRLKVRYYKAFATAQRGAVGRLLAASKERLEGLQALRASLHHVTAEAAAAGERARHLVGRGLRRGRSGEPVWVADAFLRSRSPLLDLAVAAWMAAQPDQAAVRELARTDPWRTVWACREAGRGVFDVPAGALSEVQKSLVAWTRVYDAAREDSDRPAEDVVADDDAFDGWMTVRREAAAAQDPGRAARLAGTTNEKILGSEMVFVCRPEGDTRTPEEFAAEVYAANGAAARDTVEAILTAVDRAGTVSVVDTPDRAVARRMAANRG